MTNSIHDSVTERGEARVERSQARMRWAAVLLILAVLGWLWPHDPVGVPDRLTETAWILGWTTVIVLIGATSGYFLKSGWSILAVPLMLYVGGAVHWFQFEWGFRQPDWADFLWFSAAALGVLVIISGIPAAIACRVVPVESHPFREGVLSVRLSAAVAGLLALLAVTTFVVLPLPYLGGLLGFAAFLAGIGVLQEDRPTISERLLAFTGMVLGTGVVVIQVYALWDMIQGLI